MSKSIIERVFEQAERRLNKKLKEVDDLLDREPIIELLQLESEMRDKRFELFLEDKLDELARYIKEAEKKRKQLKSIIKNKTISVLFREKDKIEKELSMICFLKREDRWNGWGFFEHEEGKDSL